MQGMRRRRLSGGAWRKAQEIGRGRGEKEWERKKARGEPISTRLKRASASEKQEKITPKRGGTQAGGETNREKDIMGQRGIRWWGRAGEERQRCQGRRG